MTATLGDPAPSPADDAPAEGQLAAALAAFQAELPRIGKGNTADTGQYTYRYADLADVSQAAMPLLGRHGLSFSSLPTFAPDGRFALRYELHHASGASIGGWYPLPDPTTTKPQAVGSAITYARRYTLCAVTGIAPDSDDDDARQAQDEPQGNAYSRPQRAQSRARDAEPPRQDDDRLAEQDRARRAAQMLDQVLAADTRDAVVNLWKMTSRSAFADVDVSGLLSEQVAARLGAEQGAPLTIKAAAGEAGKYVAEHGAAVVPSTAGSPPPIDDAVAYDDGSGDDAHEAAAAALRAEYDADQDNEAEDDAARADAAAEAQ